jgi:hypothetical protein
MHSICDWLSGVYTVSPMQSTYQLFRQTMYVQKGAGHTVEDMCNRTNITDYASN